MPRISRTEFSALPLRVNTLLADVPLHDVWAVSLPRLREGVTLDAFLRGARKNASGVAEAKTPRLPWPGRALVGLRLLLGRIFQLDAEPKDANSAWFANRLTPEDRTRSSIAPGAADGHFRVVYRFANEQLVELHNRTVHAAALTALVEAADGYRYYFAVYVASVGWITPLYMALIDPFRRWIIYPAMLENVRAKWVRTI